METNSLGQQATFSPRPLISHVDRPSLGYAPSPRGQASSQAERLRHIALAMESCSPILNSNASLIRCHEHLTLLRSKAEAQARFRAKELVLWITVQGSTDEPLHGKGTTAGEAVLIRAGEVVDWTLRAGGPTSPFLAMTFELNTLCVWEIAEKLGLTSQRREKPTPPKETVLCLPTPLLSCIQRTVELLAFPESFDILYTGIVRELCYWLLKDHSGLRRFTCMVTQGRKHRVDKAVHYLHQHFKDPICVERLAILVGMSSATLHRHFKDVMSVSPHQYLMRLRLLEARRLITSENVAVKSAAFEVGYESVSHFSREFTRMFGLPPGRGREEMN